MDQTEVIPIGLKDIGHIRLSDRSLEDYQKIFNFKSGEIAANARILDVGGGYRQLFRRELESVRPDLKIFTVDPSLAIDPNDKNFPGEHIEFVHDPLNGSKLQKITPKDQTQRILESKRTVAATAPHLPFKDRSFEYVFDNNGAFAYLPDKEHLKEYVGDVMRILSDGGIFLAYPIDSLYDMLKSQSHKESIVASKPKVGKLLKGLGIDQYEFFQHTESLNDNRTRIRWGIKITKSPYPLLPSLLPPR